jgi:hypothetical protein
MSMPTGGYRDVDVEDDDCLCEFPSECNGTGVFTCEVCGGDQCVCACGGEMECPGCDECPNTEPHDDFDDEEDD